MTAPVPDHAARPVAELRVTRPDPRVRHVEFWTARRDEERLSWSDIEDAVEHELDEATAAEFQWPMKVYGWARLDVSDPDLDNLAESLVESASEWLNDERYGDPEGDHRVLDRDGEERLRQAIIDALFAARKAEELSPWACEIIETREVTEAEAREWCPSMFDDRLPPPGGNLSEVSPS